MDLKAIILGIFAVLIALTFIFYFINSGDPNMSAAGWTVLGGIIIAGIIVTIVAVAKR